MNICFWNIHKNKETQSDAFNQFLLSMLRKKEVDVFCVAEYKMFNDSILLKNGYEILDKCPSEKVQCYKKIGLDLVQIRVDDRYIFFTDSKRKKLFICLHAYDARNYSEGKRLICMYEIKGEIDEYIKKQGTTYIFIFGDFNCMPYSDSIMSSDSLNCVLYRELLDTRSGTQERYYNPMLLLLSEEKNVYGSFFSDSLPDNLMWYSLDQVIVNKEADKIIDYESIELIKDINGVSLMNGRRPNSEKYSDHLPLFFSVKEDI